MSVMDPSARMISEEELLENLAWVQALARKLVRDPGRAEDVAQDVWLSALERPPRGTTGATLRAWLARVVHTLARQSLRTETSRLRRELAAARDEALPATSDVVARTSMQQRLVEAVLELDEPERTTVLLRYVDGLSSRAIAAKRGENPAAVRKRLSRALGRLRGRFAREYGDEGRPWIHALMPLAFGGGGDATKVAVGELLGGALVSKTSWTVGVAAAVVALGAAGWFFLGGDPPSIGDASGEVEVVELPGGTTNTTGEDDAAALERTATNDGGSARIELAGEAQLPGPIYVLTDPEDRLVASAELLLCRGGTVLARGETDVEGRLAVELQEEGQAKLLAIAPGWPAQIHKVSLAPETHEVSLRPGAVLSGLIVVDGGQPDERIPLTLFADSSYLSFKKELGASTKQLKIDRYAPNRAYAQTEPDGSFRFDGLPADWSGSLWLPSDYHLKDPNLVERDWRPSSTYLREPVEQLRIEVEKLLALTGRVVDYRGRQPFPVPAAEVSAGIQYPHSAVTGRGSSREITDPDGRFRLALKHQSVRGGVLYLSSPYNKLRRKFELEPREVLEDWDLGDVALVDLDTTRTVQLAVFDAQGLPISGAVAAMDLFAPISDPTAVDGRTSLRGVVPGRSTIVVYAVGFQVTTVSVPEQVPEEIEVTLPKGAVLELHFNAPDGEPTSKLQASLTADRHPLREGTEPPVSIFAWTEAGCSPYTWSRQDDGSETVHLYTRETGLIMNDLVPGLALGLRVTGRFGELLEEREIAPLGREEWRKLDVALTGGARTLRGRVLDETGQPVSQADVSVSWFPDGGAGRISRTESQGVGRDGSFALSGLYARTVSFLVSADGYVDLWFEDYELPADETSVELRLTTGRDLVVRVFDLAGRPVPARVSVRFGDTRFSYVSATTSEPGTYLLRNLPEREVNVRARVHGVSYWRSHDPLDPELVIEVPALGAAEATLRTPGDLELDDDCHLWFLPDGDSGVVRRYGFIDPTGTDPVLLPDILPGRYLAVVRRWHRGEIDPQWWFEEIPDVQFEELSPRVPLVIHPGETTRVEIW